MDYYWLTKRGNRLVHLDNSGLRTVLQIAYGDGTTLIANGKMVPENILTGIPEYLSLRGRGEVWAELEPAIRSLGFMSRISAKEADNWLRTIR